MKERPIGTIPTCSGSLRTLPGRSGTRVIKVPSGRKGQQFIQSHLFSGRVDAYTLAVVANFAVDYGKDREFARRAIELLLNARTEKDELVWWSSEETSVYSTGTSANGGDHGAGCASTPEMERRRPLLPGKHFHLHSSKKDASGTWGTTQATIMALRALLLGAGEGHGATRVEEWKSH